jgi:hypothetical protein
MAFSERIQRALDRCWEWRYGSEEETISLLDGRRSGQHSHVSKVYTEVSKVYPEADLEKSESNESLSGSNDFRSNNDLEGSLTSARIKFGQSIVSLGSMGEYLTVWNPFSLLLLIERGVPKILPFRIHI